MIGIKKYKNASFLGQKYTNAHMLIGNKFSNMDDLPIYKNHSDEVYENKNMMANHPTGLKHNKIFSKKSYLEKK